MVRSARDLQAALNHWFSDTGAAAEAGSAAAATVAAHAGAAVRARALVTAAVRPSAP
jgi:hypothetical protein